ncbi:hypothetical protein BH23PLA1_BH23PLA1_34640 [soil metagenome]
MRNADIIALDRQRRPVLVAEVKARSLSPTGLRMAIEQLTTADPGIRFGMVVDYDLIRILNLGADSASAPLLTLKTVDILRHYDPEFTGATTESGIRVFHDYLGALVESWLRDLAYRWKSKPSESPPALKEVAEIGLLPLLEGGTTLSEVRVGNDLVC